MLLIMIVCTCPDQFDDCSLVTGECSDCSPLTFGSHCESCVPNAYRDEAGNCTVIAIHPQPNQIQLPFFYFRHVNVILLEAYFVTRVPGGVFVVMGLVEIVVMSVLWHTSISHRLGAHLVSVALEVSLVVAITWENASVE